MMKIKPSQKLRIVRYLGSDAITIRCNYSKVDDTLDNKTAGAVHQALEAILSYPCRGVSATFNGLDIQVDLLD